MKDNKAARLTYWMLAAGWTILIYSTLYMVRPVCTFLKDVLPFALLINSVMLVLLGAIVVYALRAVRIQRPSEIMWLMAALGGYLAGMVMIAHPEEKVHFIEYGVLAYFVFKALRFNCSKKNSLIIAFMVTALAGWGDELIQGILPNRYYQNSDVALNAVSGGLGLILTHVFQRE